MKNGIICFLLICIHGLVHAGIELPELFSDNMVLQQNSEIKIWGTARARKQLTITTTWSEETYSIKPNKDGTWEVIIKTTFGSFEPQTISLKQCGAKHSINNVLIGEVWLCSGQSNMEMYFKGFNNQPISTYEEVLASASEDNGIRMLTVKRNLSDEPTSVGAGKWKLSTAKNILYFSAVAYHFAQELKKKLEVPVGIINSSYGGSTIEGWLSKEIVSQYDDVPSLESIPDSTVWRKPTAMYNGMIAPYTRFTINGFLWYQGEGSVDRYVTYEDKLVNLVDFWRNEWGLGDLPFYVVEITPYLYDNPLESALLREAQFLASKRIPNCEIVSTNDLLLSHEHLVAHPSLKAPIGKRLANLALFYHYNFNDLKPHSPSIVLYRFDRNEIEITLAHCYDGIQVRTEYVGFEIAGEDQVFYSADAVLSLNKSYFRLSSSEVPHPVAVRYCFKNLQLGNVVNSEGLPLIPFRTDDWEQE
ncbi:MAG: sialate O-acetylesterase [Crocinitomicaceae bacterium]|nr:sialate O-acetylesterase [Crocinitomicaceae bacterium]